jgi:succinylglutamate desuccinylase
VELGRIGTLGQNDLSQFAPMSAALHALLRGEPAPQGSAPLVFNTAQSITKLSDAFRMASGATPRTSRPCKRAR